MDFLRSYFSKNEPLTMPVEHFFPIFLAGSALIRPKSVQLVRGSFLQLDKYETAPNFIQLTQNLTSDCLLI
jgi:hypothetical protein